MGFSPDRRAWLLSKVRNVMAAVEVEAEEAGGLSWGLIAW
jgi:hypothetical protein